MSAASGIEGVEAQVRMLGASPCLIVTSERPLCTLSSAVWGGGLASSRFIVNRQVDKSYDCPDPAQDAKDMLVRAAIPLHEAAVLLTAAYVADFGCSSSAYAWREEGADVCLRTAAWVTAGLGNTARAGEHKPLETLYPGTINTIVVVDGALTDAAMIGAVMTAVEAKTAVLQDLQVKTWDTGTAATGTTTDAIVVGATGLGRSCSYAGTSTRLGQLVGRTVYEATYAACSAWLKRQQV